MEPSVRKSSNSIECAVGTVGSENIESIEGVFSG